MTHDDTQVAHMACYETQVVSGSVPSVVQAVDRPFVLCEALATLSANLQGYVCVMHFVSHFFDSCMHKLTHSWKSLHPISCTTFASADSAASPDELIVLNKWKCSTHACMHASFRGAFHMHACVHTFIHSFVRSFEPHHIPYTSRHHIFTHLPHITCASHASSTTHARTHTPPPYNTPPRTQHFIHSLFIHYSFTIHSLFIHYSFMLHSFIDVADGTTCASHASCTTHARTHTHTSPYHTPPRTQQFIIHSFIHYSFTIHSRCELLRLGNPYGLAGYCMFLKKLCFLKLLLLRA